MSSAAPTVHAGGCRQAIGRNGLVVFMYLGKHTGTRLSADVRTVLAFFADKLTHSTCEFLEAIFWMNYKRRERKEHKDAAGLTTKTLSRNTKQ